MKRKTIEHAPPQKYQKYIDEPKTVFSDLDIVTYGSTYSIEMPDIKKHMMSPKERRRKIQITYRTEQRSNGYRVLLVMSWMRVFYTVEQGEYHLKNVDFSFRHKSDTFDNLARFCHLVDHADFSKNENKFLFKAICENVRECPFEARLTIWTPGDHFLNCVMYQVRTIGEIVDKIRGCDDFTIESDDRRYRYEGKKITQANMYHVDE